MAFRKTDRAGQSPAARITQEIVARLEAGTGNLAGGVCIIGLSYWLAYASRDGEVVRDRA